MSLLFALAAVIAGFLGFSRMAAVLASIAWAPTFWITWPASFWPSAPPLERVKPPSDRDQ